MRQLFDEDPTTGVRRWFEGDGKGGFNIITEQMFPIGNVDMIQTLKADTGQTRWDSIIKTESTPEVTHYAHFPGPVLAKLAAQGVDIYDGLALMVLVNSPEYCLLRSVDKITHGIPEQHDEYKDAVEHIKEKGALE